MHLKALSREVESVGLLPRRYSSRVVLVYSPGGIPRGWSWFTPPEVFLAGGLGLLPRRYSSWVVLVYSPGGIPRGWSWFFHQGEILSRSPWPSSKTRSYLGRLGLLIRVRSYLGHPSLLPRRDLIWRSHSRWRFLVRII